MNGAEHLLRTALGAGIDTCFANPGTSEMQLVAALDTVGGLRAVLGLFEGVCTGAADGYARMTGRPALTLLHLGPGLANGLANLHNARRARSPVVNLVGDHASWHLAADAPLTSDIDSLAKPVGWVRRARSGALLARDFADTVEASYGPAAQPATLIVPQDFTWEDASGDEVKIVRPTLAAPEDAKVAAAAESLRTGAAAVLFVGGLALGERGLRAAARIAATTGCRVLHEFMPARIERGAGLPCLPRLPYFPEQASAALEGATSLVLVGVREPVAFFGYPGMRSDVKPSDCRVISLASPEEDGETALEAAADALGAAALTVVDAPRPAMPTGSLDTDTLCQAIAALQPEGAIIVDESATSGLTYFPHAAGSPRHTVMTLTGGAIGQGLPNAVGAAIACPDRRVIAFQADGSGMYTLQSLWTMARESLDVTVVVCANRLYRILQFELMRAGNYEPGPRARGLTDLSQPALDWVALAKGMGVPAVSVTTADQLCRALARSLAEPGPSLIEALV